MNIKKKKTVLKEIFIYKCAWIVLKDNHLKTNKIIWYRIMHWSFYFNVVKNHSSDNFINWTDDVSNRTRYAEIAEKSAIIYQLQCITDSHLLLKLLISELLFDNCQICDTSLTLSRYFLNWFEWFTSNDPLSCCFPQFIFSIFTVEQTNFF